MPFKELKPVESKPKYEAPAALRLDNLQKGSGYCMNGSSAIAVPSCIAGNMAGSDCENGNSPDVNCTPGSGVI